MSKFLRVLTVVTEADIKQSEIPLFRGAVIGSLGENVDLLYHNHIGDQQYRYSYPLVQYKRLGGKASIVCVEEGVDIIGQFLLSCDGKLRIGEREVVCDTKRIQPSKMLVQTWEQSFNYHISRWLPLNSKNYQLYQNIEGVVEKVSFLEKIMIGNLLSMLKGLDVRVEKEIVVKFTKISEPFIVQNKGVRLMAFNVDFNSNLSIPNNLGIGKNASLGYGTIHQIREKMEDEEPKHENN